jgi:type 1 fimbria pilin
VQLLDAQSNPLPLNTSFLAGTAASEGLYNLNWNARYIQTSSQVRSGTANATAVFTLTYL